LCFGLRTVLGRGDDKSLLVNEPGLFHGPADNLGDIIPEASRRKRKLGILRLFNLPQLPGISRSLPVNIFFLVARKTLVRTGLVNYDIVSLKKYATMYHIKLEKPSARSKGGHQMRKKAPPELSLTLHGELHKNQ